MSTDMPSTYWDNKEEKTCNNCSLRNKCKIYKQHRVPKNNKVKLLNCSYWKLKKKYED